MGNPLQLHHAVYKTPGQIRSMIQTFSFDIESLFTNIPLQETIDLCVENLFQDRTHVDNLSKESSRELITKTVSESLILFDQ